MKILLLNQDWFAEEFRQFGHEVLSCGMPQHLDVVLDNPLVHISTLEQERFNGFKPDAVVILDNSAPIIIDGLEDLDIPVLFLSVDVHHHLDFHKYLCHVFDYTFVAQKDYIPKFEVSPERIDWMPLWASRYIEQSAKKKYGAVFVGTLSQKLNPGRVAFFDQLKQKADVLIKEGRFWEIFPFSEIVINQTVKGDLNFRVFEAMMSGAMLLTEQSNNGLRELFTPGEHLMTYRKDDVDQAAEIIGSCLADKERTRQIALAGREEILARHTPRHRAQDILKVLEGLTKHNSPIKYFSWMVNLGVLSHRLFAIDAGLSKRALVPCMKAAEAAMKAGEALTEDLAMFLVHNICAYEQVFNTGGGVRLLNEMVEAYPRIPLLKVAKLRAILNQGNIELAKQIASELSPKPPEETFRNAEEVISMILTSDQFDVALASD